MQFRAERVFQQYLVEHQEVIKMQQKLKAMEKELKCVFTDEKNRLKSRELKAQADRQKYGIKEGDPEELAAARRRIYPGIIYEIFDKDETKGAARYDARNKLLKQMLQRSTMTKVTSTPAEEGSLIETVAEVDTIQAAQEGS